jgi:hypothetical protein
MQPHLQRYPDPHLCNARYTTNKCPSKNENQKETKSVSDINLTGIRTLLLSDCWKAVRW